MEFDVSLATASQTGEHLSNGDESNEVKDVRIGDIKVNVAEEIPIELETGTVRDAMSGLNEKIEKLAVELKFMHDENDNLRLSLTKDKAILTKAYEATILKRDKEYRAKLEEEIAKEKASMEKTYEARIHEKDQEIQAKELVNVAQKNELQGKLDIAQKIILEKEDQLSQSIPGGCGCRHSETHNCDWVMMQEKNISLDQVRKDLEQERTELVARIREQEVDSGELSRQMESMRTKAEKDLQGKQSLLSKTESMLKVKDELLDAKQEIIENLKFKIGVLQEEISKNKGENQCQNNLTSNSNSSPMGGTSETVANPKGVDDACEFIKVYSKDGVLINGFLLWANLQRVTRTENEWKEAAVASFLKSEITDAKDSLWRICGDKIAIPYKKRQGSSKSTSEVEDIAKALKLLAEKECLPLFMATGDMVKETPIASHPAGEDSNEKVMSSLKDMEDTLKTILESTGTGKESGTTHDLSGSQGNDRVLQNKDGSTVTWADDNDIDLDQGWETQTKPKHSKVTKSGKQVSKGDTSGKQSWKDKLNILRGTATGGEINEIPQSADVHLVAYGFGKDTTGEQLKNWLQSNGLQVKNCILLTKYEGARSNTFKISIKAADYEKATNPDIWPENVGVRKFKFFDTNRNILGKSKSMALGKSGRSNFSQPWKTNKSSDLLHKGFLNFHPPSDEQVRRFHQSFTPSQQDRISNISSTPPGHTYNEVTPNGGNTPTSQNYVNNGAEQSRMVGNMNVPGMYNYGGIAQNNGSLTPSMNLQRWNQNGHLPFQSAFRAEEGVRGGHFQ